MLDDAILLNMDSIQENDRLSLIPTDLLQEFVRSKEKERREESLERARMQALKAPMHDDPMHKLQLNSNLL